MINRRAATAVAAKDILAIWRKRFDDGTLMTERGIQEKVKVLLETYDGLGKTRRLFKIHGTGLRLRNFANDAYVEFQTKEQLDQEIFSVFFNADVDERTEYGYGHGERSSKLNLHEKNTPFQLLSGMVEDFQIIPGSISSYNPELALDCDNFDATAWLAGETDDFDPHKQESENGDSTMERESQLKNTPTISSVPSCQENYVTKSVAMCVTDISDFWCYQEISNSMLHT